MEKKMNLKIIAAAVLLAFSLVPAAKASVTGSIGFSTPTLIQADASPTGNINTATMFALQGLSTTDNTAGIFAGLPIQSFGNVDFDTTKGTSLMVSDAAFGTFTSDTITDVSNINGFRNLLLEGEWSPGSGEKGVSTCSNGCDAEFRMSLTQTPPMNGEISFSGTMSVAQAVSVVPEPPTALLFLSGIGMVLAGSRLRRFLIA